MIELKIYSKLPDDSRHIREQVFIKEQGFVHEFDEKEDQSTHIVLYVNSHPAATCRFYQENDKYIAGRFAVLPQYRKRGLGNQLLATVESEIINSGGKYIWLGAQQRAKKFYEKAGYKTTGCEYMDEYCPHIWMNKKLE